ncbi:hypothetical protein QBC44DRAFT_280385 [Cladorrhinum sp. PSN332]|nr:hypothetical protein QBC44DRAFT_280385 [Cladorrhinum sp. PSN332]
MRGFSLGSGAGGGGGGQGGTVGMALRIAPIVCSFFAFVFLAIATSSGGSVNHLESLAVVNLNMSTFGKNMIGKLPNIVEEAKEACGKVNDGVDKVTDKIGDGAGKVVDGAAKVGEDIVNKLPKLPFAKREPQSAGDSVGGFIGGIGDKIGDGLEQGCNAGAQAAQKIVQFGQDAIDKALGSVAKAIGVKEYYSVHIGNLCEGEYTPLFSNPEAKVDVKKCTPKFSVARTNLSKSLDEELSVGPFKFRLSEIDIVDTIQDVLDLIPRLLAAMGFFFLFATIFLSFGFVGAVALFATDFKFNGVQKYLMLGTLGFSSIGWVMAGIGTVGITFAAEKIKKEVNEHGEKFGMSANTSGGLYFLMWSSSVLAGLAVATLAYAHYTNRHPSGARSGIDEGLDEQKNVARGQYPITQGTGYTPGAGSRESYYPDDQLNAGQGQWEAGRPSKEYYQQ